MENILEQFSKISTELCEINIKDVQDVLKIMEKMRKISECSNDYIHYCHEILRSLWHHMESGFVEFDDQLLCSTCFYTILSYSNEKEHYLTKLLELLNYELDLKDRGVEVSDTMFNTISHAYGIFQSVILQQNSEQSTLEVILEKILTLLTIMSYEYSQYTFITFKIMTFFKKVIGTEFQSVIFNKDCNVKLLNIINHNWENPITGVRSLNKIIFHNLISVVDESEYKLIEQKLNSFYWNKAKYLMLAEVIECLQINIKEVLLKYGMVEGLVYSLKKAGLVSAGADMYVAILKRLNAEEEWCTIFLPDIIKLVKGSSMKPMENFNNYWCLNTLKKFPVLSRTIYDEIMSLDNADHKLYSYLCIIQQSNRLGLLEKYFINCDHIDDVLINLEHNDVHIRMVSFNIMCGLHNKFLPNQKDYDLILDFLKNNVNSDSSILRISMIKSFQNFLIQLHKIFINNNKNHKDCELENLTKFCKQFQIFVIESLDYDGNYQRKVATIQLTQSMLTILKEIPRKNQKGCKQVQTCLTDFIKSRNQWILSEKQVVLKFISLLKDPNDDIREHVMNVLMNNYSKQLCESDIITYLTEEALYSIRSRFFYQISCGQSMFKLILNILLIENCTDGRFKNVEDIFDFAYNEIKSECNSDFDIVKSIVDGKQLHSYLNILFNIFKLCLEKSYELNISINVIHSLIELLKNISNQFAWEQESSTSSDFSKMNDMVEELIARSEYKICHQFNETNISGLHQIVLNCLWLNVKASCELASILIQYYKDDKFQEVCEKCLNLICNVLETSRHKGAIEAGGATLGQAIQQLTSLPSNFMISKLPMLLLKTKIKQLILETSNMASVTRRGAGLSIMIHRIVSSDMKKGKPLFHYFMQTLLETYNKIPEYCNKENGLDKDNEKDLPQAIYIHFLTKIVIDSSLASDIMYYSGKLAKLAFDNLASPSWQIRNAALQLYGSLIPKLIGQKKNSGASDEVMATVAVDEFRTHSLKLWEYIEKQLKDGTGFHCDVVQCHNNLVPILSILANLAPIYSFTNELESKENLLPSLVCLLGSPIYVVRRLTSKCILNIYPFKVILNILQGCVCDTENWLHGTLILLNNINKQYDLRNMIEITNLQKKLKMLISRKSSYLSREQFESTFPECINLTDEMVNDTLSELYNNISAPGIFLWANFRIQLYLEIASWDKIPHMVTIISNCSDFDTYCETLCKRINFETSIHDEILSELSSILYSLGLKRKSVTIWRILYEISLHSPCQHLDTSLLHQYILNNEIGYSMRYTIPLAARIFMDDETEKLLCLSHIIFQLCHPEIDLDMRLIAATANNEIASKFGSLSDSIKINAIKAAVICLQDEDEDVRNLSVHFYRKANMDEMATHPYICWRNILSNNFLHKVLNDPHIAIQSISDDVLVLSKSLKNHNEDEYNPFASDSKNMYLELEVVKKVLYDLKDV